MRLTVETSVWHYEKEIKNYWAKGETPDPIFGFKISSLSLIELLEWHLPDLFLYAQFDQSI